MMTRSVDCRLRSIARLQSQFNCSKPKRRLSALRERADRFGDLTYRRREPRTGSNEPGLTEQEFLSIVRPFDVEVTTIDKLLLDQPHLRWRRVILKIDVEGCEFEVLTGARQLFASGNVVAVIWEKGKFHDLTVQAERDAAIFNLLDAHGFEHFYMENESLGGRIIPLESRDLMCNIYSLAANSTALSLAHA